MAKMAEIAAGEAGDLYAPAYLGREAERAGVTLVEYLIGGLRHARRTAGDNLDAWREEHERAERLQEIVTDQQLVCAGLICPDCGAEPIKEGHGAECVGEAFRCKGCNQFHAAAGLEEYCPVCAGNRRGEF